MQNQFPVIPAEARQVPGRLPAGWDPQCYLFQQRHLRAGYGILLSLPGYHRFLLYTQSFLSWLLAVVGAD